MRINGEKVHGVRPILSHAEEEPRSPKWLRELGCAVLVALAAGCTVGGTGVATVAWWLS